MDYRYLKLCLWSHQFPLPVIATLNQDEAENHVSALLDLEDGFHQIPLMGVQACTRHPFGHLSGRSYKWV